MQNPCNCFLVRTTVTSSENLLPIPNGKLCYCVSSKILKGFSELDTLCLLLASLILLSKLFTPGLIVSINILTIEDIVSKRWVENTAVIHPGHAECRVLALETFCYTMRSILPF